MKAKELIKEIYRQIDEVGDVEVVGDDSDGVGYETLGVEAYQETGEDTVIVININREDRGI